MGDNCTMFLILLGEEQLLGQEFFLGIETLYLQRSQILSSSDFCVPSAENKTNSKSVYVY